MIDRLRGLLVRCGEAPSTGAGSIVLTSIVSMALRVAGILLALLSQLYLARLLGAAEYGRYVIALGWAMLLVIVARRGLDNMALRVATHYWEEGRRDELAGLVRYSLRSMLLASLTIVGSLAIARLMWPNGTILLPWSMLLAMGASILPLAVLGFYSSLLRSAGRIIASQGFEQLLRPLILIALLFSAQVMGNGLGSAVSAMALTAVSLLGAALAAMFAWRRSFPVRAIVQPSDDRAEWRAVSMSFVIMALAQEALNQSGVLLLGILGTNVEAAHYAAAWRYSSLLTFGLAAVSLVAGPLIASAHRRSDQQELAGIVRTGARFSFAFALVAAAPLLIFGKLLLGLFGPAFVGAYPVLLILLAGSLVNASTGVVGYLVALTGGHNQAARVTVGALAINLFVSVILIPRHGAVGAAAASMIAQILWNLALLVLARKSTGVTSWVLAPTRQGTA